MFRNPEEMLRFIEETGVEQIDFKNIDLIGRWHHVTFSTRHMAENLLTRGSGISMSPYPGYRMIHQGDMVARPDVSTAFIDPFHESRTLTVITDAHYPDGRPYERNSRDIARKAEAFIADAGLDGASQWLPEMEFNIIDGVRYGNTTMRSYYDLAGEVGPESTGEAGEKRVLPQLPDTGVGQCDAPRDRYMNLRAAMVRRIEDAGYPVKYNHHELGGAGQCEIEPHFSPMLRAADSVMVMKYIIRNTAAEFGKSVTFMPKPMYGAPGNGMHFHQYIQKKGKSLFYDEAGYACMNELAMYYVGGLCHHNSAIMAFGCPSTNSYRRFGVGLAAPMNLFFSESNRSSAVRIPAYDKTPEGERVEYRLPDGLCNPYLTMAAQLMAGLDGIINKIDPRTEGYGPFDVNNYELPPEERAKIKSGPTSLEQALDALAADHEFLTAGGVFPEEVIQVWINLKLRELDELSKRPHPYEFELYYDM